MKNYTFYSFITFILISCNGVKVSEQAINSGNYDTAISKSIQKISGNKSSKKAQKYVPILETAFKKVTQQDSVIQYLNW